MTAALLAAFVLAAAPVPKGAGADNDWPQWRGPNRDGKSGETGINFPSSGPKLLWKSDKVGMGYGQPAVVGNRLYIIGSGDNKAGAAETLVCLSVDKGEELWKKELGTSAGKFMDQWGGGPRSTPTVVDGFIYVLGSTGDIVCFKAENGDKVWGKNLVKDFGGKIPAWGYSESPLVDDGQVIVTPGSGTGMVALDAKTGKTTWTCKEFNDGAGYSSVVIMMVGDKKLYIQQTMKSAVGVFAKDGKQAFKTGEIARSTAVIPTPVIEGEYAFFTAGYRAGCECYKITADGDKVKASKVFTKVPTLQNHHGGVIGVGDYIYGHSDSGGWTCLPFKAADPEPAWQSRKLGKGSITFADNHLFCYSESDGTLACIKATKDGWEEIGRMTIPQTSTTRPRQGMVWPHPVIAQGKLFLRDFDLLFAFDVKAK